MADVLLVLVTVAYVAVVAAMFVFGVNFSYMTWSALRDRHRRPPAVVLPPDPPAVTVQLPIYNERYVAARVIDAVVAMEYPRPLQIQVLDDSTDDTVGIVAERVAHWHHHGVPIEHIRRADRTGFKAGALDRGMSSASGELIALFDADFVPPRDFLRRAVPALLADDDLAFVQARWTHINRNESPITRVQAMSIDGHFGIEQQARWSRGHCFNFNGTAGVWRRAAIEDAGGWTQRTLTEDLDLSYRACLRGWRAAFLHDLEVPAELPASVTAYRSQQHRWARGSFQCARLLLPELWRSGLRLRSKIEGTLHLGGYAIHLLLLSLVAIFPAFLALAEDHASLRAMLGSLAVLNLIALSPAALFLSAQQRVGRRWYRTVPVVVLLTVVGTGMMVNTARAAVGALRRDTGVFERTPKFGFESRNSTRRRLAYQARLDRIVFVELLVAAGCAGTVVLAVGSGVWAVAVYAAIFGTGLAFNAALTIWQTVRVAFASDAVPASVPAPRAVASP